MEKYLGVKLIEAEPMTLVKYNSKEGVRQIEPKTPGNDGYLVKYEDGYESWSPKDVFEKAYRKIKQLDIRKKELLPHQTRVQDEAYELNDKVYKLNEFILNNKIFNTLPEEEQIRLQQQLMAMRYYLTILVERIENFK